MGLLDKLLGGQASENIKFDQREGYAAVLISIIASDGHISDDEARTFNTIVNRMQLFKNQTGSDFSAMIDKLMGILQRNGSEFLLNKGSEVISPDLRETAFATAVDLVLADGVVEDKEKKLLANTQTLLNINDINAEKIIEVMLIKNRG